MAAQIAVSAGEVSAQALTMQPAENDKPSSRQPSMDNDEDDGTPDDTESLDSNSSRKVGYTIFCVLLQFCAMSNCLVQVLCDNIWMVVCHFNCNSKVMFVKCNLQLQDTSPRNGRNFSRNVTMQTMIQEGVLEPGSGVLSIDYLVSVE